MTFASVCSGVGGMDEGFIEAGMTPLWFSEIDKNAAAVLAYRHPDVLNLGDMRTIVTQDPPKPDVLIGGTPCQAFSVSGLREGLADERGNLTLEFVRIADHLSPTWLVWENVFGVLSSDDNAFGIFLAGLVGADQALCTPGGQSWPNAGMVAGPKRILGWRILDAQFFGVAQRRRRVFVVGHSLAPGSSVGEGELPERTRVLRLVNQVLFESESLRRDTPPRREKGARTSPSLTCGSPFSRTGNERVECEAIVATRRWTKGKDGKSVQRELWESGATARVESIEDAAHVLLYVQSTISTPVDARLERRLRALRSLTEGKEFQGVIRGAS